MIDPNAPKFISDIWPVAKDEELRSGIKPLITVSQAGHESGWGQSELTQRANNLFGLTGESWEKTGKTVIKIPTKEFIKGQWVTIPRPFRAYKSWADSVRDWANLLHTPNYKLALPAAIEGNAEDYAKYVAQAGYATDPNYASKLAAIAAEILKVFPNVNDVA